MLYLQYYKNISGFFPLIVFLVYWYHKPFSELRLRYLAYFCLILTCCELLGIIFMKSEKLYLLHKYLFSWFVIPFEFLFYFWFFFQLNKDKRFFQISILLYLGVWLFEMNFIKENTVFFNLSFLVGNILLLFSVLRFFYEFSLSDKILNFYNQADFWIALGILIFWLGSLPYYVLLNYLWKNFYDITVSYCWLVTTLILVMYSFMAYGLVCSKKTS
jgi:hypothetical protein